MKYLNRFLLIVLLFAAGVFGYSFYQKNQLVAVDNVSSATLAEPVQTPFAGSYSISFKNSGDKYSYDYAVKPVFNYAITGIVVSKHDYNPADDDIEKPIRYDLCIVWGKNVSEKTYLSKDISFSQSQRFCNYSYNNGALLYTEQISNNHIITNNPALLDKLQTINPGDEVSVSGQLVNMSVSGNDSGGQIINTSWKTSTGRKDTGAGACEVIYASSIDVITSVHGQDAAMNMYAQYVLIGVAVIFALKAIIFVLFAGSKKINGRVVG